ncbi:patatin-like phospholipase family protein [Lysobacter humi (ex Lee et al. 2017)]
MTVRIAAASLLAVLVLAAGLQPSPAAPPGPAKIATPAKPAPVRIGLALGGGAAKGFAHIGVIKMLEANGIRVDVVAGTSAGSVVGALYASGQDAFRMQTTAFALDEDRIRDVSLFATGGVVKGERLQAYVNELVRGRPLQAMRKPFAAVATRLEDGKRTVFTRGDTGQAVRASSSIPGVFEAVRIGKWTYVDGGVVSPVPVDAARQLGADFVIAVDISSKAGGRAPGNMLGNINQSITIMGQKLGELELKRADVVIRPAVLDIGAADFEQKNRAILEGERAALAMLPTIRARLDALQKRRAATAQARAQAAAEKARAAAEQARLDCEARRSRLDRILRRDRCPTD